MATKPSIHVYYSYSTDALYDILFPILREKGEKIIKTHSHQKPYIYLTYSIGLLQFSMHYFNAKIPQSLSSLLSRFVIFSSSSLLLLLHSTSIFLSASLSLMLMKPITSEEDTNKSLNKLTSDETHNRTEQTKK